MRVYEAMVKSSLLYGSETWRLTERFKSRLKAVEIDVLKRSSRTSRREHVPNEVIKKGMGVEDNISKDIERKQLVQAREAHGRLQATQKSSIVVTEYSQEKRKAQTRVGTYHP
ncbi:hypothetical protein HHI36_000567 [Cryptolaemus montrouzieri]|uniref:Uncharacterized protein n=1 Tax=Cryptolaemus montrouzieri TaxID=559131 RepID=A0ABD2P4W8_9CUCU